MITTMDRIKIPFSELHFSFTRSSGPGGQNVNKVNSKVTLIWDMESSEACSLAVKERFKAKYASYMLSSGEVQLIGQKSRSQKANMDDCIERLHAMLNDVRLPPKIRRPTKPKKSAVIKRLNSKRKDSEKKQLRKKPLD
jgi:ribosome-associated protein